ncbi:MAG: substrate-binding domain-containing protein [Planctomycetales bacterium]|nr:substrate-binding domain-containing protein [Planctomycetales bacterium]
MLRKLTAVASLLALLVTSTLFLTGCNKGNTDNAASGGGTAKRRIILLTNGDDPFWDAMREGMNAAAKELDLASHNLEAVLDKGDFSDEAQINKLNQYATQTGIAAVAISSVDAKNIGIADAMKALRANGVHVITVDSDMDDPSTRFGYLGTNNVEGGQELGKAARGLSPDGGVYATFVGLKTVANAIERIQGFKEGAGDKFKEADSLADQGDENQAQENVKTALNTSPKLDTLVGIWAYNAHAIVNVVKEREIRDRVKVVVFDAAPAALDDMANGMIDAMIVQNPYQMGYLGTKLMKALIDDDGAAIQELYPAYDPATKTFTQERGDILTTELRVVVPNADSPLKNVKFNDSTQFFTYDEFRAWMNERNLKGS